MEFLKDLNKQQFEAVTHDVGSVFVIAGAGTGKTRTLTMRIAYLIAQGYDPSRIMAVTFTNKAAKEMKSRVIDMVGPSASQVWMYTFHAFGLQILRKHIHLLPYGYLLNFNIIDEEDAKVIIKEVIKSLNLEPKDYSMKHQRHIISLYKTSRLDAFEFNDEENIYLGYVRYLREHQFVDFDDLILYTQELLKTNEEIRTYYQQYFEHILIDEFQDTDVIQYDIIKMLGITHKNVFVVGDPDQSIYAFRGSHYANNQKFLKEFSASQIILDQNYRSTNDILHAANLLINHNQNRILGKLLKSDLGKGKQVHFYTAQNDYQETYFVIDEIRKLKREGAEYSDIAILYRNNALSRIFEDALIKEGLPYKIYGGISFYERKEIKDAIAYIHVILDPIENFYLKRIINVPRRGIGQTTIAKLEAHAREEGLSMFDAIDTVNINGKSKQALLEFKEIIESIQTSIQDITHLDEFLASVLDISGYMDMLKADHDEMSEDRISNLKELVTVFKRSEGYYEGNTKQKVQQLLDQIALYTSLDKSSDDEAIILSTIHQVKGLEFKAVFMVVMEEGIFPSDFSLVDPRELEEERRVCYVGVTRAKRNLYISHAQRRMVYGQFKMNFASRFLREMKQEKKVEDSISSSIQQQKTYLSKGDKVTHTVFGDGVVITMDEDVATIAFPAPHGIKRIVESHPALKKKALTS
ncbi:MAG: ATP-dependent helicase [Acholeplasmataceae bacterium]